MLNSRQPLQRGSETGHPLGTVVPITSLMEVLLVYLRLLGSTGFCVEMPKLARLLWIKRLLRLLDGLRLRVRILTNTNHLLHYERGNPNGQI
jgi:hypothetical protein